jgi:hypothetical protein
MPEHPRKSDESTKTLVNTERFSSFIVPLRLLKAALARGTFGGTLFLGRGYFAEKGGWMALTDVEIRRAKAREKAYRLSDSGGMYLWVTPAGGKLWRWAYVHEGKEKLMSFGRYPDVSLAIARERTGCSQVAGFWR